MTNTPTPTDPAPRQAPPHRNGCGVAIAFVIIIGMISWWIGSASNHSSDNSSDDSDTSTDSSVVYEVRGTDNSASVTMETPSGTVQNDVDVPMMNKSGTEGVRFPASSGTFIYISAQKADASGTVECIIQVDGETVSDNTSSAEYGIASCKGTVP
jgi:hypothetical protein